MRVYVWQQDGIRGYWCILAILFLFFFLVNIKRYFYNRLLDWACYRCCWLAITIIRLSLFMYVQIVHESRIDVSSISKHVEIAVNLYIFSSRMRGDEVNLFSFVWFIPSSSKVISTIGFFPASLIGPVTAGLWASPFVFNIIRFGPGFKFSSSLKVIFIIGFLIGAVIGTGLRASLFACFFYWIGPRCLMIGHVHAKFIEYFGSFAIRSRFIIVMIIESTLYSRCYLANSLIVIIASISHSDLFCFFEFPIIYFIIIVPLRLYMARTDYYLLLSIFANTCETPQSVKYKCGHQNVNF